VNPQLSDIDPKAFPQTAKLVEWFKSEQEKGLVDIKFYARHTDEATVEAFCADVNLFLESPEVADHDIV
jgi:hypothetical protein